MTARDASATPKSFDLLRWFSIGSFLCIALTTAVSSFLLARFFARTIHQRDATRAMEFVQSVAAVSDAAAYFEAGAQGEAKGIFQEFVLRISDMPEVIRTSVYAKDGLVIWSDDARFIGHRFNPNPELNRALLGELVFAGGSSGKPNKPEHVFDDVVPYFVEIYIPIWNKSHDRVMGVVEVYKVPLTLLSAVEQANRLVWITALLGGGVLYLSLFWIVRRGALVIRRQENAEKRFRKIFEEGPIGMLLLGPDLRFIEVNQAFCRMLGYAEPELIGRTFAEITHPDDVGKDIELAGRFFRGEISHCQFEKRYLTKDNRTVWANLTASAIGGTDGKPLYSLTTIEDITERRRAEEDLRHALSLLHTTIESTADGLLVADLEGKILSWNHKFVQMWRIPQTIIAPRDDNQALACVLGQLKAPEAFLTKVKGLYAQPNAESYDVLECKDGRIFERYSQPQRLGERSVGRVWSFRDVTARHHAEEQLRNSREQLRALSAHLQYVREEERTRIAREIHDELGQALTGLRIDLSWLGNRLSSVGPARDHIKPLIEKTHALITMVDATIQTVRRISTELRPGALDSLGVTAAIEWEAEQFQARTGVPCAVSFSPETITLDSTRSTTIFRILQEALTNVARHAEATRVDVRLSRAADGLILEVRDNGKGMTEHEIADPRHLGLLGIRERAHLVGGEVQINGAQGKGTTVAVRIPPVSSDGYGH